MDDEKDIEDSFEYAKGVARKRFNDINKKSLEMIEDYITGGYKKSLVNLLIYLGPERAEKVLKKLPEELRDEIRVQLESDTNTRTCC